MSSEIFQAVLCVCASGLAQGQGTGLPGGLPRLDVLSRVDC